MKFIDKANFLPKLKEISENRNILINNYIKTNGGPELLLIVPLFIASFYQGIQDDSKTAKIFHILANASRLNLVASERFLAFFFFWSLDRFFNHKTLHDEKILVALKDIWGWDKDVLNGSIEHFNIMRSEEVIDSIIRIIAKIVGEEFDSIFVVPHITNALKFSVSKFN